MCFFILVTIITKFEKSQLAINLAKEMDMMDRTWEWFTNCLKKKLVRIVEYMSGLVINKKVRFGIKIFGRILYYQVIFLSAFLLTRDDITHNWRLDWRDTNMKVHEYRKHFEEYFVLFLIMLIE